MTFSDVLNRGLCPSIVTFHPFVTLGQKEILPDCRGQSCMYDLLCEKSPSGESARLRPCGARLPAIHSRELLMAFINLVYRSAW